MTTIQQTIGKYHIINEIASGAFGRVYRAEDATRQNRPVAVKLMHAAHLGSALERSHFLQEAQLLTLLKHPFIVPVLDVGIEEDFPYLVMDLAPNGSLYDRLKLLEPRTVQTRDALNILAQIGMALHYAHQQNIIHRDLKPANILFNTQGDALLADFGIATILETSIKYGSAVGTPYYMAPEQFRGTISKESDQYSLGCIAYQLFTGRLPFTAPDFFSLGYKHMTESPLLPSQLNLLISRPQEEAILRAMAKQRTDRFPDIPSFLAALGISLPAPLAATTIPTTPPPLAFPTVPITGAPLSREDTLALPVQTQNTSQRAQKPITGRINEEEGLAIPGDALSYMGAREESEQLVSSVDVLPHIIESPLSTTGKPLTRQQQVTHVTEVESKTITAPRHVVAEVEGKTITAPTRIIEAEGVSVAQRGHFPAVESVASISEGSTNKQVIDTVSEDELASSVAFVNAHETQHEQLLPDITSDLPVPFVYTGTKKREPRPRHGHKGILFAVASLLLVLLLLAAGLTYTLMMPDTKLPVSLKHTIATLKAKVQLPLPPLPPKPTPLPTAQVAFVPAVVNLDKTYSITAVTGTPDPSQNQVQARSISNSTSWQTKTIQATGQGTIPGTQASGILTLINDSSSPQTYTAGTTYTGTDGVQVALSSDVTVPAGSPNPETWGTTTVPAYAVSVGSSGNIPANDITTWISIGNENGYPTWVEVYNTDPFSGGTDSSTYTYITQDDYNNAVSAAKQLVTSETASAQTAIADQVQSGESYADTIQCSPQTSYNHSSGDHVSSITASAMVSCSVEVYAQQAAFSLAQNLLKSSITIAPNASFVLTENISTSLRQVQPGQGGTVTLLIEASSAGTYQFGSAQKQELASLIAGKSVQQAQAILQQQVGITQVSIQVHGNTSQMLPTEAAQITITVENQT